MPKRKLRVTDILEHSAIIRGDIINSMTNIERIIDFYLAKHFCHDIEKEKELIDCVFATKHITFESKRQIFNYITNVHKKEIKQKELEGIHGKLDKFNEIRNILAHSVVDFTKEAQDHFLNTGEVTFTVFLFSRKSVRYTIKSADDVSREIVTFATKLKTLFN